MKMYLTGFLFLFLMMSTHAEATFSGPYIVYTLEVLDAGDEGMDESVPDSLYLYPHVYSEADAPGTDGTLRRLLKRLGSFKPKLYQGTDIQEPLSQEWPIKSVTILTSVKTKSDFKKLMSEVVYTFDAYNFSNYDIPVTFHFNDPKLEKKYGGQVFKKKDVSYAVFILTSPNKNDAGK